MVIAFLERSMCPIYAVSACLIATGWARLMARTLSRVTNRRTVPPVIRLPAGQRTTDGMMIDGRSCTAVTEGAMMRRIGAVVGVLALGFAGVQGAQAAMHGNTVTAQKTAGKYRLVLKVGPAEMMSMNAKSGERMMSGRPATCAMVGMSGGSGMNMSDKKTACNRHVELHVYQAKGGAVVQGARVTITMTNMAKHTMVMVPMMTMEDARMGMKDLHYGNNVYAPAGMYTVHVQVNRVKATFSVHLM
jgi:hypothetical protein